MSAAGLFGQSDPDFRVRIFNIFGIFGFALGIIVALFFILIGAGIEHVLTLLIPTVLAAIVLPIANRTKRFKRCFLLTVIAVFMIVFPILFFTGGGYHSGMPNFFVFGIVFTVLMLEGQRRTVFTILLVALYSGCLLAERWEAAHKRALPTILQFIESGFKSAFFNYFSKGGLTSVSIRETIFASKRITSLFWRTLKLKTAVLKAISFR
jgi:hypothetical protein